MRLSELIKESRPIVTQSYSKILFISFVDPDQKDDKRVIEIVSSYFPNAEFVKWNDLDIINGQLRIKNGSEGVKFVSDYDAIFTGPSGPFREEMYSILLAEAKKYTVKIVKYGAPKIQGNKVFQSYQLSEAGIAQVPSIICSKSVDHVNILETCGDFPIVGKILNGSKGEGVQKIKSEAELNRTLKKLKDDDFYCLQKFIENDGDYRILVVYGRPVYVLLRQSKNQEKEFRNNTSLGGKGTMLDMDKVDPKLMSMAIRSAQIMNQDIAGVDIIQDKISKEYYVMEINSAPQIKNDADDFEKVKLVFAELVKHA